ncbi:MAG: V-type ATP synthase subunit E [Lachnospiraceae bacterium]|nr:V-type ATP synthase subunit E [Lachnospiraceae bacterium]
MAGIDSILKRIAAEADVAAEDILGKARSEADRIRAEAKEKAVGIGEESARECAQDVEETGRRYASLADSKKRQALLSAKQEMIASCVGKARDRILSMDTEGYFGVMTKLLRKAVTGKDGTLYFSGKDLARMPSSFAEEASKIACEAGGSLTISKETRPMNGGFVLAYGGIEENCSIDALFEERADALSDAVRKILFS